MLFACQGATVAVIFVKKSAWSLKIVNDKTPRNTSTDSEAVRASSRSCNPHATRSEGLSIQDEFIDDVAYHSVDAMCLIP